MKSIEKVLRCDCGFEARTEHEDELVAEIQRHAWEAHAMALAPEEARSIAFVPTSSNASPRAQTEIGVDPRGPAEEGGSP